MRASSRVMSFAVALWMIAVLTHALVASSPSLRFWLSPGEQWLSKLNDSTAKCRIILIGSSPVVFGLSAADLQAATGCTTVNLALISIGNQLNTYLKRILQHVRAGDVVVLSDRLWTINNSEPSACADENEWLCFFSSIRFTPYSAEDFEVVFSERFPRNERGDLVNFPPLTTPPVRVSAEPLNDPSYRLRRIKRQAALINAHGAHALFAATPILVTDAARPAVEAEFLALGRQIRATIGDGVWIGPALETDPALFSLEGQHPSDAGRHRWTNQIKEALLATLQNSVR